MENMHTDFKVQRVNSESALFVTSVSPPAGKQDSPQLSRGRVEENASSESLLARAILWQSSGR